ncbi:MAG TPA: CotS family spore coat protein [Bacillales bacterium]|nr:CotS family spore coat protein [Bacillales bacterium]
MLKKYPNILSVGPVSIQGEIRSILVENLQKPGKPNPGQTDSSLHSEAETEIGTKDAELTPEMRERLTLLGREILKEWDLDVQDIEVVQGGQMALVWKVTTPDGPVCLKRINRPEKKALFSIHAQNYLVEKGAHVPSIIITKNQQLYAKHGPFLFVVYDWIEGRQFDMNVPEDIQWMMKGLAEYHIHSKGFLPPEGLPAASKLGEWPKHYTKRFQQMDSWKLIAEKQPDNPFSQRYLELADEWVESGKDILKQLDESHYNEWIEECKKEPNLCHQDYGTGNTILVDNEVWVIDLDTTAYDLPIRDLRKIIIPMMTDYPEWQDGLFDLMLDAYEKVNPLTNEQKSVMYIDMMFPYELYDVIRDKYSLQSDTAVTELDDAIAFERTKQEKLKERLNQIS